MAKLTNVHTERVFEDELCDHLAANGWNVRTHLKDAKSYDQPLLHTMYVDKRLSGVLAVQTLSRLNRTYPGKEDTFVLDFVNKPEEILASFQPYYRAAKLEEVTDPNIVHELMTKLGKANVYTWAEVEAFGEAFFDPKRKQAGLHAHLKPAADRFNELKEEKAETFRKDLGTFLRMYDFLSQIVPYNDAELEKLYVFGKNLMPRLQDGGGGSSILELDSGQSVYSWEQGKSKPRGKNLAAIAALRGIGKREVTKRLEALKAA